MNCRVELRRLRKAFIKQKGIKSKVMKELHNYRRKWKVLTRRWIELLSYSAKINDLFLITQLFFINKSLGAG